MLLARLVDLATRTARGKRLLWRGWYDFLATRYPDPGWTFMNYGYRAPEAGGAPPLALDAADEADRSCIQLYDLVARGRARRRERASRGGLRPGRRRRLPGAPARRAADRGRRSVAPRRRALPPPLRAPAALVRDRRRRAVAVRRRLVRRRAQRRVVALLRPLRRLPARSAPGAAPGRALRSTPTFVRARRSHPGGRRCSPPVSRSRRSRISGRAWSPRSTPTRPTNAA